MAEIVLEVLSGELVTVIRFSGAALRSTTAFHFEYTALRSAPYAAKRFLQPNIKFYYMAY
jgi:hypothetical protein